MWYTQAKKKYTGVMIGLFLPRKSAEELADAIKKISRAESADQMHVTLCFLGDSGDMTESERECIENALDRFVNRISKHYGPDGDRPLSGNISGTGRFICGDPNAFYASLDCISLNEFREDLIASLRSEGIQVNLNHGFTPHITLAYVDADSDTPDIKLDEIPVKFDKLTLAWGGDYNHFKFL